jgi:hypothetical protein
MESFKPLVLGVAALEGAVLKWRWHYDVLFSFVYFTVGMSVLPMYFMATILRYFL